MGLGGVGQTPSVDGGRRRASNAALKARRGCVGWMASAHEVGEERGPGPMVEPPNQQQEGSS